jgi:allantoinase
MVAVIVSEGYNKGRISLSRLVEILSTNAAKQYPEFRSQKSTIII